jgi:hypothetical protein
MSEGEEVRRRRRRSGQEIQRLVAEFGTSGLRPSEFCRIHGLTQYAIFASYCRILSTVSKPLTEQDQSILQEIKPAISEVVFARLNESIRHKEELLERLQRENKLLRELRAWSC